MSEYNWCPFKSLIYCNKAGIIRRISKVLNNNDFEDTILKDSYLVKPILTDCRECIYHKLYLERLERKKRKEHIDNLRGWMEPDKK